MKVKQNGHLRVGCLVMLYCVFFSSVSVLAADGGPMNKQHTFSIAIESEYFKYTESGIKLDGLMVGLDGDYQFRSQYGLILNADVYLSFGQPDYDGQTWGGTPVTADSDDFIVEPRVLLGYEYAFRWSGFEGITPYSGFGYRYWNNNLDGSGSYEREIQYWYLPLGIKTVSRINTDWTWGIILEYDLFLSGKVDSHLSDAVSGLNDVENNQDFGDGYGTRVSIQFKKQLPGNRGLSIEPYFKYWDIDDSDAARLADYGMYAGYYVYEPANKTKSFGLRLRYHF